MKKILLILLTLSIFGLVGCTDYNKVREEANCPMSGTNWISLCEHSDNMKCTTHYFYDSDTEIVYVYINRTYGGAMSVYYNSNGEPMTKTEFETIHMDKYHK